MKNIPMDPRIVRRLAERDEYENSTQYPYDLRTKEGCQAYIAYNEADWKRYPDHKKDWRWQLECHIRQELIPRGREQEAEELLLNHLLTTEPLAQTVEYQVKDDILCFRIVAINGWRQQTYVDHNQRFSDESSAQEQVCLLNEAIK